MVGIMSILEDRIRSARLERGMSPSGLAKAVGVTSAAVSRWEKGQVKNLRMEHLFSIANLLQVDPEWLATGRGNKHKPVITHGGVQEDSTPYYSNLNNDEQLWVNIYRSIPAQSRKQIKVMINQWLKESS